MRTQRTVPTGMALIALLGLAFTGWTFIRPASAQDDKPNTPPPPMMGRWGGPAAIAASGDYVYVLRGNTLFQMKTADLSVVTQKDLPSPAPAGAPAAPGTTNNQ